MTTTERYQRPTDQRPNRLWGVGGWRRILHGGFSQINRRPWLAASNRKQMQRRPYTNYAAQIRRKHMAATAHGGFWDHETQLTQEEGSGEKCQEMRISPTRKWRRYAKDHGGVGRGPEYDYGLWSVDWAPRTETPTREKSVALMKIKAKWVPVTEKRGRDGGSNDEWRRQLCRHWVPCQMDTYGAVHTSCALLKENQHLSFYLDSVLWKSWHQSMFIGSTEL